MRSGLHCEHIDTLLEPCLGENVTDHGEGGIGHFRYTYLGVIDRIRAARLPSEISG